MYGRFSKRTAKAPRIQIRDFTAKCDVFNAPARELMGFRTNADSRDIHPVYGTRRKNRPLRTVGFAGSLTAHNIIFYLH